MSEELEDNGQTDTKTAETLQTPRPSSPRKFFARIYGHLEEPKRSSVVETVPGFESDSSSDVEIGESEGAVELQVREPQLWPPPPPLPLCPRPMLLPHQQLAFGAGLAAFRKLLIIIHFVNLPIVAKPWNLNQYAVFLRRYLSY
ncbi:hypothetical protein HF086_010910 [Spodoptera exigua]|uniref:Uncharacterized protein n=1 Tax=Spodoptera exigua TaxID=7107 RepID=A0A922MIR3_SPOEX|nr:hypothetical protein HF086_010910 [Spodoptera exigua]